MQLEEVILKNLINCEEYMRKVHPFLKIEYFHTHSHKILFETISDYIEKYNASPSKEALYIELNNKDNIGEDTFKECIDAVKSFDGEIPSKLEFLIDQTEKFCQDKAVYNAIMNSIKIFDDKSGKLQKGSIPQLLSDALAVSFDTSVGHSYTENIEERFEFYHKSEERIPFDIEYLNIVTNGGLPRKTLSIILAESGGGKSLAMCHMAAANLQDNKNVLYITMEMAEERIAERIDANLMNITLDELREMPKETFIRRASRIKDNTKGRLIIKEYPTASAGAANFRHLLNELKIKKNFTPDIIYIDYLNICSSSRIKNSGAVNSFTLVKNIAEEIRGLAVEFNVPIISATQTTRQGFSSSDLALTDTSESIGLVYTVDFMIGIISSDELKALNQIMVKQLKNRFGDPDRYKRFIVGIDKSRMKLYNCEESAQNGISDDIPVFDTGASKPQNSKFKLFK